MRAEKQHPTHSASDKGGQHGQIERRGAANDLFQRGRAGSFFDHDLFSMSPMGLMRRMVEDMSRAFEGGGFAPAIEVFRRNGELVVRADLPGLRKEDVHVEVKGDTLFIEGERRSEHQESQEGLYRSELSYGSFRRAIVLPEGVDPNQAQAHFDGGVLEVSLKATTPQRQSKPIEITSSPSTDEKRKGA